MIPIKFSRKCISILFGFIISIISIIWIVRNFNLNDVLSSILLADYRFLIPVILLILFSFVIRSYRWGLLFNCTKKIKNTNLFTSMMIGYFGNNILPARMGEVIRIYALNKQEGIRKRYTLATVVVERICDLIMALFLLSFILFFYPFPESLQNAGLLVSAITLIGLLFIVTLNFKGEIFIQFFTKNFKFLPEQLLLTITNIGTGFIVGLTGLRKNKKVGLFVILTIIIWAMELGILFCMALAFNITVSLSGILFVMVVTGLGTIVPSSPGYIGTYEFFTLTAFSLIGITGNAVLSFSIATHAITLIVSSAIGVICIMYTGIKITNIVNQKDSNTN